MPKGTATCNAFLNLLYRATAWANVADNAASSPLTSTYGALHTASPGAGGTQATNETAYTNYARQAVARSGSGWGAASGGAITNAADIVFPQCGASGATITDMSMGKASSSTGDLFHYGTLNSSIPVSNLITPRFVAGAVTITET